jgi:sterol desaturase/sphingolipid hydroxylase (fatty acid hydroxylase superfamily)
MHVNHLLLIISLYAVFGILEMHLAAEKGQTINGRLNNIFYGSILFITGIFVVTFLYSIIPIRPRHLPQKGYLFSACIAILYLVVADFMFYWYHRAQHAFKYFWAIHELHHSDREMNVTTSMRSFWLERPLQTILIIMPLYYIIGIDSLGIKIYFVISVLWLFFSHANLKLHLGFFTCLFVGPQVHRIHHSILPQHQGKNLAQFFPVYDILFGTFYKPAYNEFPPTGVSSNNSNNSITNAFVAPFFTWLKLLKVKHK